MKNEKQIKIKFLEIAKGAGFKNLHSFCKETKNPLSKVGHRSCYGVNCHFKKPPYDIRVLRGYARDLKISEEEVYELFQLEL